MLRWGSMALAAHSAILVLIAPSAFMYFGEGFILTGPQAHIVHRLMDGAVEGLVYDIANYRIPHGVYWWLADRLGSLDEVTLITQTALYLIVGGAFYFLLGAGLGAAVALPKLLRKRSVI